MYQLDFSLMIFTITELFIELLKATPLLVFKDGTHHQCLVPNPELETKDDYQFYERRTFV
jgi:hypothetical protein